MRFLLLEVTSRRFFASKSFFTEEATLLKDKPSSLAVGPTERIGCSLAYP